MISASALFRLICVILRSLRDQKYGHQNQHELGTGGETKRELPAIGTRIAQKGLCFNCELRNGVNQFGYFDYAMKLALIRMSLV